jgi:hypothetical protein
MTDPTKLEELARKAASLFPLMPDGDDEAITCPLCGGDGDVAAEIYDATEAYAAGCQVFGVGPDLKVLSEFIAACDPDTILSLCEELQQLRVNYAKALEMLRDSTKATLEAGAALARAQQTQWVSVKERLPEKSGMYYVSGFDLDENDQEVRRVWVGYWNNPYWSLDHSRITHWALMMPLPAPPEVD